MQHPPEIVIKDVPTTPYTDQLITRGLDRLEKVYGRIIGAHIALEREQGRHQKGNPYRMRIIVRIPDRADIIVERSSKPNRKYPRDEVKTRDEPLTALIRGTFDAARRQLEKEADKQRGAVKTSSEQANEAVIEQIFPDQEFGFLRTLDGQQVYFHKNSLLHRHWKRLTVGTAVRYVPEIGEKGLQASTVEPVDKRGAAELHKRLHDLPEAA